MTTPNAKVKLYFSNNFFPTSLSAHLDPSHGPTSIGCYKTSMARTIGATVSVSFRFEHSVKIFDSLFINCESFWTRHTLSCYHKFFYVCSQVSSVQPSRDLLVVCAISASSMFSDTPPTWLQVLNIVLNSELILDVSFHRSMNTRSIFLRCRFRTNTFHPVKFSIWIALTPRSYHMILTHETNSHEQRVRQQRLTANASPYCFACIVP